MQPSRVLLVDDSAAVRAMVRRILESVGARVVGEAADGLEALDKASDLEPAVVFLDVSMPRMNGLDAAARLKRDRPHVRVVILSMYDHRELIERALALGVDAYVIKGSGSESIEEAFSQVVGGGRYLCPRSRRALTGAAAVLLGSPA